MPFLTELRQIREALEESASDATRASFRKFVPASVMAYGVRLPVINALARQHKTGGFELAIELWRSGAFEEKLLAAKILGMVARSDPARTISLVCKFSESVSDWAVCDTLGMQSIKSISAKSEKEVFEAAARLLKSPHMWSRRLGIVLLTHFAKLPSKRVAILGMLKPLRQDKEHYVRKAIAWIDRDLTKV